MEKLFVTLICLLFSFQVMAQPSHGRERSKPTAALNAKIKKAETQPNNLQLLLQIANGYLDIKEYEKATDWFDRAQKVDPNNANVYYMKGVAQYMTGEIQWAEACSDLMTATKKDRSFHKPYVYLGRIYRSIGKFELAEHFLNQGLRIKAHDPELLTERARLHRSDQRPDAALDDLIRAISKNSDFAPAYAALAQFYLDRSDEDKAIDYANQALDIEQDNIEALQVRARALLNDNQVKKACLDIDRLRLLGQNVDEFHTDCR
ncbi:MAG: tetratricopeptide repeat protein [Saprospiraceae bacterium]|nr:tetratricopeptide repeat protein [Saprospiraceae bacterium]